MLDQVEKQGHKPDRLLADSLYGSDDNCAYAHKKTIELVAPAMGALRDDKKVRFDMFSFAGNGEVFACPAGHAPYRIHNNTREATNSELARRTGIKKLRIRGLAKVSYCVKLKAIGLNILRVAAHRCRKGEKSPTFWPILALVNLLMVFKEQIVGMMKRFQPKSVSGTAGVFFRPI